MKSITLIFIISLSVLFQNKAQKITEDKIDDFTGDAIQRTSWEFMHMGVMSSVYFRASKINESRYFELKVMNNEIISVDEGQNLMLKLSGGELIKLPSMKYSAGCRGCGSKGIAGSDYWGIQLTYPITEEDFGKLTNATVEKIRIYSNKGYIERDIKPKYQTKVLKALSLLD